MTNLPIYSAILASLLIVMQVTLMLSVGMYRLRRGVFVGDAGDVELERLTRRHGNLAENAGLFLAALAVLELLVGQTWFVAVLCLGFALARTLHAIGLSSLAGSHGQGLNDARRWFVRARSSGAFATFAVGLGAAVALGLAIIGR